MKILILNFLCFHFIFFVNCIPIDVAYEHKLSEVPEKLLKVERLLYTSLDANDFNNFTDLSWVHKDENDSKLLKLKRNTPFVFADYVQLQLYVNESPDTPYLITLKNCKDAPIYYNRPTKIMIHGYQSNGNNNYTKEAKDSLLRQGEYNVIVIDYEKYANFFYPIAVIKGRKVGAYIGEVITGLFNHNKIRLEDVHIFGLSLGAHVSGFVGKTVQAQTDRKIGRITGLDPAGPIFEVPVLLPENKRLHEDDAIFTDIIHTGGGSMGFRQACGHVDFFPNGGLPIQPGCGKEKFPFGCSHIMAAKLYIESIQSNKFLATPCTSWNDFKTGKCDDSERIPMGHHLNSTTIRGRFYLRTGEHAPHALG